MIKYMHFYFWQLIIPSVAGLQSLNSAKLFQFIRLLFIFSIITVTE